MAGKKKVKPGDAEQLPIKKPKARKKVDNTPPMFPDPSETPENQAIGELQILFEQAEAKESKCKEDALTWGAAKLRYARIITGMKNSQDRAKTLAEEAAKAAAKAEAKEAGAPGAPGPDPKKA